MAPPRVWGEHYVRPENTALRRALQAMAGRSGRVLEAGCGAGRFIRTIARGRPDLEAYGCDLSAEATQLAAHYPEPVRYAAADLTALPYPNDYFDLALVFDVLEHVEEAGAGLSELARVLRPGGLLHALVPCEGQPWTLHWLAWRLGLGGDLKERHGAHVQRFTHRSLGRAVGRAGFDLIDVSFSMHPVGQLRDLLIYLEREDWFRRGRLNGPLFRALDKVLWAAGYGESRMLARVPLSAVAVHLTVVKA